MQLPPCLLQRLTGLVHSHDAESADQCRQDVDQQNYLSNEVTSPNTQCANLENLYPKENPKSSLFDPLRPSITPNRHEISLHHLRCIQNDGPALVHLIGYHLSLRNQGRIEQRSKHNYLGQDRHDLNQLIFELALALNLYIHLLLDKYLLAQYLVFLDLHEIFFHIYERFQRDLLTQLLLGPVPCLRQSPLTYVRHQ